MEGVRKKTPTEFVSREPIWLNDERINRLRKLYNTDPREMLLFSNLPSAETTQNH